MEGEIENVVPEVDMDVKKKLIVAPSGAGKSHFVKTGKVVDGDEIVNEYVGWPTEKEFWKLPKDKVLHLAKGAEVEHSRLYDFFMDFLFDYKTDKPIVFVTHNNDKRFDVVGVMPSFERHEENMKSRPIDSGQPRLFGDELKAIRDDFIRDNPLPKEKVFPDFESAYDFITRARENSESGEMVEITVGSIDKFTYWVVFTDLDYIVKICECMTSNGYVSEITVGKLIDNQLVLPISYLDLLSGMRAISVSGYYINLPSGLLVADGNGYVELAERTQEVNGVYHTIEITLSGGDNSFSHNYSMQRAWNLAHGIKVDDTIFLPDNPVPINANIDSVKPEQVKIEQTTLITKIDSPKSVNNQTSDVRRSTPEIAGLHDRDKAWKEYMSALNKRYRH